MKLKVNLYTVETNFKVAFPAAIWDCNIIPDKPNGLPCCSNERVNFTYHYAPTYIDQSKGIVNTRFLYPYSRNYKKAGTEGRCEAYAYLTFWQRIQLSFIAKNSVFHRHTKTVIFIILNIIGFIPLWIPFLCSSAPTNTPIQKQKMQQDTKHNPTNNDSIRFQQIDSLRTKTPNQ